MKVLSKFAVSLHEQTNEYRILNLIIDIGNNSAKFFLFQGKQIILHTRKAERISELLDEWKSLYTIEKAIVSSVVDIDTQLKRKLTELAIPVIWFNNTTRTPLKVNYSTPETLGSDRLAAAVGAWSEAPGQNILVIDAGSAITVDFVGKEGTYNGGNISPGIKMRLKALHEFTGRLPLVEKEGDTPFLGHDTETAIRSGVFQGVCHEIEGYISEFQRKYGNVLVFLTGGDENSLKNNIKSRIFADKFLVAKGMNRILLDYDNK